MLEELDLRIGEEKPAPGPNIATLVTPCVLSFHVGVTTCKVHTQPCTW